MPIYLIKRSATTKIIVPDDQILKSGELAYSYADGDSAGGDRLFIGAGDNTNGGKAAEIHTVGGKYFIDMMDHPKGQLKPSSAIITDANSKIDKLNIDNISIDGNNISSTSGNITIDPSPAGNAGKVIIAGDLQVDGTTTTINSTTLTVNDKNIVLAQGAVSAAAADSAGISIFGTTARIWWDYPTDTWNLSKKVSAPNIDVEGTISAGTISGAYAGFDSDFAQQTTNNLSEGSNLYFTNERVDDRVFALLHAGEGIDLNYNDFAGELDISVELATSLNPGIATFDATDFLVTAGNVEIQTIDCGSY